MFFLNLPVRDSEFYAKIPECSRKHKIQQKRVHEDILICCCWVLCKHISCLNFLFWPLFVGVQFIIADICAIQDYEWFYIHRTQRSKERHYYVVEFLILPSTSLTKSGIPSKGLKTRLSVASESFDKFINNNNVITWVCINFVLLGKLRFMQIKET